MIVFNNLDSVAIEKVLDLQLEDVRALAQEYKETYTKESFIDLRRQLTL